MKIISLFCFIIICAFNLKAQEMPNVLGVWCSAKKDLKVQLYKTGNTIEGKIIWLLEDKDKYGKPLVDKRNNKPLIGLKILWDAVYNPITQYFENGIAFVKGREFCGKFKLNDDGTLSVTGFICGLKFLSKTDTWTRDK